MDAWFRHRRGAFELKVCLSLSANPLILKLRLTYGSFQLGQTVQMMIVPIDMALVQIRASRLSVALGTDCFALWTRTSCASDSAP